MPIGLSLVNSSFAMPLCEPEAFHRLWDRIREALPTGGRFSGQWYGPRDSWVGRPGMTFVGRDEALALLDGLELEMFEEEEADGVTPRGNAKHWHIFHIVARKTGALAAQRSFLLGKSLTNAPRDVMSIVCGNTSSRSLTSADTSPRCARGGM